MSNSLQNQNDKYIMTNDWQSDDFAAWCQTLKDYLIQQAILHHNTINTATLLQSMGSTKLIK